MQAATYYFEGTEDNLRSNLGTAFCFGQVQFEGEFVPHEGMVKSPEAVFFTASYIEGKPGVQPERLGPYSTTFNPGYDPSLPLYKPWPMFEAIKQANAPGGPAPSKWAQIPRPEKKAGFPAPLLYESVLFVGEEASNLKAHLVSRGVQLAQFCEGKKCLVIIDGQHSLTDKEAAQIKDLLNQGTDVCD